MPDPFKHIETPIIPTEPRFAIGERVVAYNGEPRVVVGMNWTHEMLKEGQVEPMYWGWCLETVHPDDPNCKGTGFEEFYRRMT